MADKHTNREEFRVNGEAIWAKIKELVKKGNVRHVVFKNKDEEKFFSMTVTIAAIIAIIAPQVVLILTIILLLIGFNVVIEKDETVEVKPESGTPSSV